MAPGTEPATVDADDLRHRIVNGGTIPCQAAADLGVSLELVRYLLRTAPSSVGPRSERRRAAFDERNRRAAELLTPQFLQEERVNAGKTVETIAEETGFHICLVLHHARRLGFDATHQAQIAIDPTWLREQVLTLNRASTDIAAELGISPSDATAATSASHAKLGTAWGSDPPDSTCRPPRSCRPEREVIESLQRLPGAEDCGRSVSRILRIL